MNDRTRKKADRQTSSWWLKELPGSSFIWSVGALGLFSFLLVISVYYAYFRFDELKEGHSKWSEFGSYFGGTLSGILAFLALLALLYTIFVQREELKGTKELISKQSFETAFFNLVKLYQDTLNSIETGPASIDEIMRTRVSGTPHKIMKGREVIKFLSDNLRVSLQAPSGALEDLAVVNGDSSQEPLRKEVVNLIDEYFNDLYEEYEYLMGHYFRVVYHLFKFIDRADESLDKQYYADLVRAQLSSDELYLIFYNCVSQKGRKSFSILAKEYNIFKHLDEKGLAAPSHAILLSEMKSSK